MSEIKTNKLTGTSTAGSILVTGEGNSTTTNLQQGLAKAWNNLDGTGTIAIRDSFNISGVTDGGSGRYTHSVTNALSSANIVANGFVRVSLNYGFLSGDNDTPFTTSSFRHGTHGSGAAALVDALYATISLSGDLA